MNTVAITDIDVKIWTRRSEFPKRKLPRSLTQPKIWRKINFELIDIEYDLIKDEIPKMEHVEYNTAIERNVMNIGDIEDFANL